jgi:hypothetical protein
MVNEATVRYLLAVFSGFVRMAATDLPTKGRLEAE